jgi:hypothetical protein
MKHPLAVYEVPSEFWYVSVGFGVFVVTAAGPKLIPPTVNVSVPLVDNGVVEETTLDTTGERYDVVSVEAELACPSTVTCHVCDVPSPTSDVHVICECATVTVHTGAYGEAEPNAYSTKSSVPAAAPKFEPVSTTDSAPVVESTVVPDMPLMEGAS